MQWSFVRISILVMSGGLGTVIQGVERFADAFAQRFKQA
jgi:hypothetical protein